MLQCSQLHLCPKAFLSWFAQYRFHLQLSHISRRSSLREGIPKVWIFWLGLATLHLSVTDSSGSRHGGLFSTAGFDQARCEKCNEKHVTCFGRWNVSGSDMCRFRMEAESTWFTARSSNREILSTYSVPCFVLGRAKLPLPSRSWQFSKGVDMEAVVTQGDLDGPKLCHWREWSSLPNLG